MGRGRAARPPQASASRASTKAQRFSSRTEGRENIELARFVAYRQSAFDSYVLFPDFARSRPGRDC
jgi:hypothetical protein